MKRRLGSFFYTPKKPTSQITRKRWNLFDIAKKILQRTCMALGGMMLFSIFLSIVMLVSLGKRTAPPLPDDMILVLRIENGITEVNTTPSILDPFPFRQPTVRGVIDTLDRAAKDKRVRGLVVSYQGGGISIAHTQEIRAAIKQFKNTGKFAHIYAPSYMDGVSGMTRYYFASAFDKIWMQPVGMLSIAGPSAEMPFFKNPMDRIGVTAQFKQREEFKSAMESFTNNTISNPSKVMLTSLIDSLSDQMIADIATDRDLPLPSMKRLIDKGVLTGTEATNSKLIDRLDYADVMISEIRKSLGDNDIKKNIKLTDFSRYSSSKKSKSPGTKDVALIYVTGTIVDQASTAGNAGGSDIAKVITQAYENKNIKAIVLRVDSPGGSPSASETIRRALIKAKEKGKKVIVSMGSVAASGGYWISTDADKIFASSGTLTGSIGVVMGKFEGSKLWENLGVDWYNYKVGENSDFWSVNKPFDSTSNARLDILIDDVYDAFLERVSNGRNIPIDKARKIAKGRAWTGEQALNLALVDQLGGLNDALDTTATMIGAKGRKDLNVIRLPRELNHIERLIETLNGGISTTPFMKALSPLLSKLNQMAFMAETNTISYDPTLEGIR